MDSNDQNQIADQRLSLKQWFGGGAQSRGLRKPGYGHCHLRFFISGQIRSAIVNRGTGNEALKIENNVAEIDAELTVTVHNRLFSLPTGLQISQSKDLLVIFSTKGVFCAPSRPKIQTKT